MKKVSMRKFSLLGLVLIGASAVTAAVLPKTEARADGAGRLEASQGVGSVQQLSCKEASGANECGWTNTGATGSAAGSRTSAASAVTSSITIGENKVATDTAGGLHTTQNPV